MTWRHGNQSLEVRGPYTVQDTKLQGTLWGAGELGQERTDASPWVREPRWSRLCQERTDASPWVMEPRWSLLCQGTCAFHMWSRVAVW